MQPQRKPKKLIIQVLVAAVIAIVVGVGAIALVLMVINNVSAASQKAQQQAKLEIEKAQQELLKIKTQQAQAQAMQPIQTKAKQVQALADIAAGEPITQALVGEVEVEGKASPGSFNQAADVLGKVAKSNIVSGQPLTANNLIDSSNLLQVKEGMRAISLGLDRLASLDGALMPGSFVDVLMTVTGDGSSAALKTLLQNVQVIAVPGMGGTSGSTGVTFLVTPGQAEILTLASQQTKLTLSLRNFKDKARSRVPGADLDRLITGSLPGITGRVGAPNMPGSLKKGQAAFNNKNVPVAYTPQALPEPSAPPVEQKPKYSIKVFTGATSQTVDLE